MYRMDWVLKWSPKDMINNVLPISIQMFLAQI